MVEGSIFPINNLSFFITGLLFHNYGPDYGRDYGVTTQLLNAIVGNLNHETLKWEQKIFLLGFHLKLEKMRMFFCSTSLPLARVLDGFDQHIISSLCCPLL